MDALTNGTMITETAEPGTIKSHADFRALPATSLRLSSQALKGFFPSLVM
jgi:hypothetical protein